MDDLKAFGIATEKMPDKQDSFFLLWPENVKAFEIFLKCCTQWRTSSGGLMGLDYNALFEVMALYDIVERREVFESVQIIEGAILSKMNKSKG